MSRDDAISPPLIATEWQWCNKKKKRKKTGADGFLLPSAAGHGWQGDGLWVKAKTRNECPDDCCCAHKLLLRVVLCWPVRLEKNVNNICDRRVWQPKIVVVIVAPWRQEQRTRTWPIHRDDELPGSSRSGQWWPFWWCSRWLWPFRTDLCPSSCPATSSSAACFPFTSRGSGRRAGTPSTIAASSGWKQCSSPWIRSIGKANFCPASSWASMWWTRVRGTLTPSTARWNSSGRRWAPWTRPASSAATDPRPASAASRASAPSLASWAAPTRPSPSRWQISCGSFASRRCRPHPPPKFSATSPVSSSLPAQVRHHLVHQLFLNPKSCLFGRPNFQTAIDPDPGPLLLISIGLFFVVWPGRLLAGNKKQAGQSYQTEWEGLM